MQTIYYTPGKVMLSPRLPRKKILSSSNKEISDTISDIEESQHQKKPEQIINLAEDLPYDKISMPFKEKLVTDLEGTVIGEIRYTSPAITPPNSIYLGTTENIISLGFEFSREQFTGTYHLKLVAYLTEQGINRIKTYVAQQKKKERRATRKRQRAFFKQSEHDNPKANLPNIQPKLAGKRLKQALSHQMSHDITVDGLEAHLSFKGKIDLYTPVPNTTYIYKPIQHMTEEERMLAHHRLAFSPEKRWITKTDAHFNKLVSTGVQALADVIQTTIGKYDN